MGSKQKGHKSGASSDANKAAESITSLTPEQLHALFDILTHHETYSEVESFKYPTTINTYGYPFKSETNIPSTLPRSGTSTPSAARSRSRSPLPPPSRPKTPPNDDKEDEVIEKGTSPVLQTLFTRFILPLPWLRDLPRDFWNVRIQGLLYKLADADLSESYDKGALGLRKTLATGSSAIVEMVGRGALGGVKKQEPQHKNGEKKKEEYDLKEAEDLERAWEDFTQQLVHGDLVPEMFEHMTKTDDLEGYSPTMKATAEYTILQYVPTPCPPISHQTRAKRRK